MRHSVALLTIAAAVLFLMFASSTPVAQAQPQSLLTRHVRDVTLNGQAPFVGRLPATQSMRLDIVLPVRDQAGLDGFLQELYDPSSPAYRHFLTVEQFTERFGPSQEDYDAVISFARANGFTVAGGSRDGMDVQLKGSVADIETAFHVAMGLYHDPIENRDFYAPDREPTVDLPFRLWHISGLDNYSIPHPEFVRRPEGAVTPADGPGSCPGRQFCGSDMRAAYYEGTALTGKGQNIGLFEFGGYDISDLNLYYQTAKQKRLGKVICVSVDGTSCGNSGDDSEQILDMTQALGMAPEATVYVFVGNPSGSDAAATAILASMSSHKPLPLQMGTSWFWGPPDVKAVDLYFKKMAAQGQSYFKGAGDYGAWSYGNYGGPVWPRDDAWVTLVGGTDLTTKGPGKGWASETGWSDGGGGISPDGILIPSYQKLKGVITKANQGSTKYRNGPDVSAMADQYFYYCADGSCQGGGGGVSFATPMWAGYLALANQQAAAKKLPPPGFINPAIYPLGLGKTYHTDFHDITSGGNGYPPTKGYDLTTGWGSPNTDGLINALAK